MPKKSEVYPYQDGEAYVDEYGETRCAACGQLWAACWCEEPEEEFENDSNSSETEE